MDAVTPDRPAPPTGAAGPLPAYRAKLAAGELATDPAQALAAERLQSLWVKLRGYDPPLPGTGSKQKHAGLFGLLRRRPADGVPDDHPNGLYLVGDVGRGKSMLMDLFFATAAVGRRRRIHFHQFMQEVHAQVFAYKRANPTTSDPIPPLADRIAAQSALLCFDEFQVNDIADAMILGRLFQALFDRAVVVVATSNTAPDDLFRDQPGRDAFLPFIAILKHHLDVLVINGARDFRRARLHRSSTWHIPADDAAKAALDDAFAELTNHAAQQPDRLMITGRILDVPVAADGVARFDFAMLCGTALGPGDYLAIATHFHALVLDGIPRLSPANYDQARRFITLIDALYEHRVKLVASADASPDALYEAGEGAAAFQRTASRLEEMQSRDYLDLPHLT